MIQKYILVVILIIIVIALFFKSLHIEYFTPHNLTNCKYQGHGKNEDITKCIGSHTTDTDNICCDIPIHIQNWNDEDGVSREIHSVNPNNPCCIKSCINDFTNVDCDKNPLNSSGIKTDLSCDGDEGTLRDSFLNGATTKNLHYFLTSGCYNCIKNFKGAVDLLADPDAVCSTTTPV